MNAAAARNEFDPPRQRGLGSALILALAAHLLLLLALTWGLRWQDQPQNLAVLAELWSPTVQRAAPPPPPPTPPPVQQPVRPPTPPAANQEREAEIALAQKKQREAEQQQRLAEQRERQRKEKELAEKKAAEEAKRKEQLARAKAEADKKAELARRMEALRHMSTLANADDSTGQDARSAGPSGDYAALIRAVVRASINFPPDTPGNPAVEVEIQTGPTGIIISQRVVKPSGVKAWDEAVLRGFSRIEKLPPDKGGRYWNPMVIKVNPRD